MSSHQAKATDCSEATAIATADVDEINASGHVQELERQFGLLSISAIGIVTGCSWALMGGTIVGLARQHPSSLPAQSSFDLV
jgi:hypothetical protein